MLRVIAGKYRSRKLEQPPLEVARPTMDRVKEAVFSSIFDDINGAIFMDLFSGSGNIAIEAMSRGAAKAYAVDNNKEAIKIIEKNVSAIGVENIDVRQDNVLDFLKRMNGTKFDIIYIDAPYKEIELVESTLESIVDNKVMSKKAYIFVETDAKQLELPKGLVLSKTKRYGITFIHKIAHNN